MSDKAKIYALIPILMGIIGALAYWLGTQHNSLEHMSEDAQRRVVKVNGVMEYIENNYVDDVEKDLLLEKSLNDILKNLDPHSSYIRKEDLLQAREDIEGNYVGVGIRFHIFKDTLIVRSVIPGGPADKAGLKSGDRIISVNGEKITGINLDTDGVMTRLKGNEFTKVTLGVLREGEELNKNLLRTRIYVNSVDAAYMLDEKVGYIRLDKFAERTYEDFVLAAKGLKIRGMKTMIIDLRDNGGGYLDVAINILDELLKKGEPIVFTKGKNRKKQVYVSERNGMFKNMDLLVLINENSASASEILAGAIQDNDRGIIVGRRSFGKGLVQETHPFNDGSEIRLTVARYYTPSGRSIQRPYGEGINYSEAHYDRYRNGEMFEIDSTYFADSLKYYTLKEKRPVYGGGGIMPDYFVPRDTSGYSNYFNLVVSMGITVDYALKYYDNNKEKLQEYSSVKAFYQSFKMTDADWNRFYNYANANGVAYMDDAELSKKRLENRIASDIAAFVWDFSGTVYVSIQNDTEVQKALELAENKKPAE